MKIGKIGIAAPFYQPSKTFLCATRTPNPAKDKVSIGYHVPITTNVTLTVYNVNGDIVLQPVSLVVDAGHHTLQLNTEVLAKGIYFYELKTNDFTGVKKLVRQ